MTTSVSQELSLEQMFEAFQKQLDEKLKTQLMGGNSNYKDFQNAYDGLQRLQREFQNLLQWVAEDRRGKGDEKKFKALYQRVAGWNASDLIESLKGTGFALKKKEPELKDAFKHQGYRILELVRAGKRDEAFHAILRIFVSAKKDFPSQLVEAFKPVYSDELFKVFLFSFLSGILGKEETEQETQ
jgi:hypothetical protein